MQILQKKYQGQRSESKKTIIHASGLLDIFKDRDLAFKGLTKFELMAEYFNKNIDVILKYDESKRRKLWSEISYIKKYLRKKGKSPVIISKQMPVGFELTDFKFGKRKLNNKSYIYFACSRLEDAMIYRGKLDKIANGFTNAGSQVEEIVSRDIEQKSILQTINN